MPTPIANASVAVTIGAALSARFAAAFGQATAKITAIGTALGTLRAKGEQLDGLRAVQQKLSTTVGNLTTRQDKYRLSADAAGKRVVSLKAQMAALGAPTAANSGALATFAVRLDAAQQAEIRAGNALAMTTTQLDKEKAGLV